MGGLPDFPANELRGSQNLWVITGYGLLRVWVMTGLTVVTSHPFSLSFLISKCLGTDFILIIKIYHSQWGVKLILAVLLFEIGL